VSATQAFVRESVQYLRDTYLPRLERALQVLPAADLWWRPNADVIAFGTVLLHLEGNVRQWILAGLGGAPDDRRRSEEFSETGEGAPTGEALLAALRTTVEEACEVVGSLDAEALAASYRIQGFDTSGLQAVYHVVEHFSWHTGQAVWIAKARAGAGHDLAFYDDARLDTSR